jgi:TolB-like protein
VRLGDHAHLAAAAGVLDAQELGRKHLWSDRFERDSEGLRADGGQ